MSSLAYRKAKRLAGRARYVAAGLFAAVAVAAIWWSINITADTGARAAFVPIDPPNSPIGVGKGIYPGRVVWVHDPKRNEVGRRDRPLVGRPESGSAGGG